MPEQPNVLLLMSDEHSFRYFGHLADDPAGEPIDTPNLDRLVREATTFTDAYCQTPLCTPSRISLLTGREAHHCGAWDNESVLRPDLDTLPGTFAEAGYETCLVGKMHFGGSLQFAGFRHRPYGDLTGNAGHQWEPLAGPNTTIRGRTADAGITSIPESLLQEQVVADETVAFLREHTASRPEQPWLLCASFSRPHFPLTCPRRWWDRYWPDGVTPPKVPAGGDAFDHPMSAGMREGFQADEIGETEAMRARAAYFGNVSYLDELIGDLLARLERSGLLENTIVVYTTDHGEMAGEHGVWWKNGWYEACTRVPLVVSMPQQRQGVQAAKHCRVPVGLLDLYPTLCGLAGVASPAGLDGVDLSDAIRQGTEPAERPIFCDGLSPRWGAGTEFRMIRLGRYKYIRFRQAPSLMFDLQEDPGEQDDLIRRGCDDAAERAKEQLAAIAAETMDFEAAERDRIVVGGQLEERYSLNVEEDAGNIYFMPSGQVIAADDPLYRPRVITDDPRRTFADLPDHYRSAEETS